MGIPTGRKKESKETSAKLKAGDLAILSVCLGGWGAFLAYFSMVSHPLHLAKDFSFPWRAARALVDGQNPYDVIQAVGAYPFNSSLLYPLPAAIIAFPFSFLRPEIAGALFFGLSSALLGWALLRDSAYRLPVFISAPFVHAAILGQWSPILTAAALMPSLQFVAAAKPTVGLAAWLYKPSVRGIVGGLVLVAIAFIVLPGWLADWLDATAGMRKYRGPATTWLGAFLLLGVLRWRRREGRLFIAMSLIPQLPVFYDSVILWLIPSTLKRSLALSAVSWIGYLAWYPSHASSDQNATAFPWLVFTIYAPALVLLLMLPARDDTPPAAAGETATAEERAPDRLDGTSRAATDR
jgi:hypothetical protein